MYNVFREFLNSLENPDHPSLGPQLRLLGFIGLWHPTTSKFSTFKRYLFVLNTIYFCSQYLKCLMTLNPDAIKLTLKFAPFHIGVVKSWFFQKDQEIWEELIAYTSVLEKNLLAKNDYCLTQIIKKYITRNRRVTYFFWTIAIVCNMFIFPGMFLKKNISSTSIYSMYIFDDCVSLTDDTMSIYVKLLIQSFFGNLVSIYICGWDSLVVSLMIFFAGQLQIARIYCRRIIDVGNYQKSHQNIAEFLRFYTLLVKYQKLFNSLISHIMSIYLLVISSNLGVCIIDIIEMQNDIKAVFITSAALIVGCFIQLLIFYWHSNEVTVESTLLSYSTFESNWVGAERRLQKDVLFLGMLTTNKMVFAAGPFNKMTLATFMAILRHSYSFYTLMNKTY